MIDKKIVVIGVILVFLILGCSNQSTTQPQNPTTQDIGSGGGCGVSGKITEEGIHTVIYPIPF